MNQPAFPTFNGMSDMQTQGMTLRDYFAAKAMQALLQNEDWQGMDIEELTRYAYFIADEMLKARSK